MAKAGLKNGRNKKAKGASKELQAAGAAIAAFAEEHGGTVTLESEDGTSVDLLGLAAEKQPKAGEEKQSVESHFLPCEITSVEFHAKAMRLAEIETEIARLESEKRRVVDTYKGKIDGLGSERTELAEIVSSSREIRAVECEWWADFTHRKMVLRRTDTFEALEERTMTASEAQTLLDLGAEAPTVVADGAGTTDAGEALKEASA